MEPFFSVMFSAIFLGDIPALPVLLTLIPIVGGVIVASLAEVTFNWTGFLAALFSNITFQSRNVLSKKFMISKVSSVLKWGHFVFVHTSDEGSVEVCVVVVVVVVVLDSDVRAAHGGTCAGR